MAKALNGQGSLYQVKDPKNPGKMLWQASKTVSYTAPNKVIRVSGTGKTRSEALARRDKNLLRHYNKRGDLHMGEEGLRDKDLNLTVARLLYQWLEYIKSEVRTGTYSGYLSAVELHLAPAPFGDLVVRKLEKRDVETHFRKTLPEKKKTRGAGKGVEPLMAKSTLINVWTVFSMAIEYGISHDYIKSDPRTIHSKPRLKDEDRQIEQKKNLAYGKETWKPQRVLADLKGQEDEAQWLIQLMLACRQSEKLGLRWSDFNNLLSPKKGVMPTVVFENQLHRIQAFHGCGIRNRKTEIYPCGNKHVNKCPQKSEISGYRLEPNTKSSSGIREVPISPVLADVLREHKKRQDEWKKSAKWKELPGLENLVFTTKIGTPLRHQQDTKDWRRLCEKHKLGDLRGHSARHFAATIMVNGGVPIDVVGSILGHASEFMTRDFYTHSTQSAMAEALEVLNTKLLKERNKPANSTEAEDV